MFRKIAGFAGLFALVAAGTWGVHLWRHRFVRTDQDLFRYLPAGDGSTFFANVRQVRQGGFVSYFTGSKAVLQDPDYEEFVRQTGFDYTQDLDALAAKTGTVPVLVARGRFDWSRIRAYAKMRNEAKKKKQLTFEEIQPDVIRLKTGTVPVSTPHLAQTSGEKTGTVPVSAPVWVRFSESSLDHPENLPPVLRIFAISLGSQARNLVLSLAPAAEVSGSALVLNMQADLPNGAAAETVRTQLELQTRMLALGLARQHQSPDPSGLTGLLAGGTFEAAGKRVRGTWPVRTELLRALQ